MKINNAGVVLVCVLFVAALVGCEDRDARGFHMKSYSVTAQHLAGGDEYTITFEIGGVYMDPTVTNEMTITRSIGNGYQTSTWTGTFTVIGSKATVAWTGHGGDQITGVIYPGGNKAAGIPWTLNATADGVEVTVRGSGPVLHPWS